ncbi:hypothetical protein RclHR1_33420001, partial [Rhizophagus clarus]
LSPIYISQVVLASPATLATAIDQAKLVESGVKYTLLNAMPKEEAPIPSTSQSVVAPASVPAPVIQVENNLKNELDALTKNNQRLVNFMDYEEEYYESDEYEEYDNEFEQKFTLLREKNPTKKKFEKRTREKETNFIERNDSPDLDQTTAAQCELYVGKEPISAVIDSGAATRNNLAIKSINPLIW